MNKKLTLINIAESSKKNITREEALSILKFLEYEDWKEDTDKIDQAGYMVLNNGKTMFTHKELPKLNKYFKSKKESDGSISREISFDTLLTLSNNKKKEKKKSNNKSNKMK